MKALSTFSCLILGILNFVRSGDGSNVVFFSPLSSHSHRATISPLAVALGERGHNVTYISSKLPRNPHPKVQDYVPATIDGWMDQWLTTSDMFAQRKNNEMELLMNRITLLGTAMCEDLLKDKEFIQWVKSVKVDLVVMDSFANDCVYGMVHIWKAKVIVFHTYSEMAFYMESFGLSDESDWLPSLDLLEQPGPHMSFVQRLQNKFIPVIFDYVRRHVYFPKLEAVMKEKLGVTDSPKLEEIERNTSMVFMNVHYSMNYPRSLPPHVKAVGGIAATGKENQPLPKDLETFLSKGNEFIFISFGSWGDFTRMDESVKRAFIETMISFPKLQFVWKVTNESLVQEFPNKNVFITQWVPQQTLLGHPKIRAFITQSGLISTQEGVNNAVPMICFPFFWEQSFNAEIIHRKEAGIQLEIITVTKAELEGAISKILHDPKYRNNMKRMSTLFKDRPESEKPLESAVWWSEFVLRHTNEDLIALRPYGIGQPWWKKRGVDIWFTVFGLLTIILASVLLVSWKIVQIICEGSLKRVTEKQKYKKIQ